MWETEHRPEVLLHEGRLFRGVFWFAFVFLFLLRMPSSFTQALLANRKCWSICTSYDAHRSSVVLWEVPLSRACQMHLKNWIKLPEPSFSPGMHLRCSGQVRQVGPLCFETSCISFVLEIAHCCSSGGWWDADLPSSQAICLHSLEDWYGGSCEGSYLCLSLGLV